jgi:hypothetical protein
MEWPRALAGGWLKRWTSLEICGHVLGDAHRAAVEKVASSLDATGRRSTTVN